MCSSILAPVGAESCTHPESKRVGGYLREYIHHYQEQNGIGVFYIGKCKEDTSEQVGIIRYYQKYGNFYEPDTIIGECRNKKAF